MSKAQPPELKRYMDKKLHLKLNGGRHVVGVLRGFDPFMNLVLDESVEQLKDGKSNKIGMIEQMLYIHLIRASATKCQFHASQDVMHTTLVQLQQNVDFMPQMVIRGNSIVLLEAVERIS